MTANREQQRERLTVEAVQDIQNAIHTSEFNSAELARFVGQRLRRYIETPEIDPRETHGFQPWDGTGDRCVICGYLSTHSLHQPDPWLVPGSVAIATVRYRTKQPEWIEEGVLVVMDQYGEWQAPTLGDAFRPQDVTVTSRAVVVTEADRDELIERIEDFSGTWYTNSEAVVAAIREWFAARLEGGA